MDVREKLVKMLSEYFNIGDSYAYNLARVKSAFACGTMEFDDFEEFDEETVEDIADHLIAHGVTVQELDGCDFCQKFDFAGARAEVNKYGAHISLGVCGTKFPNKEQFKFCPMCGRRLPEPPKGE